MSATTPYTIVFEGGDVVTQLDADRLGNKWTQGLHDLLLDGQGGALQIVTGREANTDDRSERPFNTAGLDENNGRSFAGKVEFTSGDLVQAVAKSATTLTFTTPGAGRNAARWRVGARFRLASEDSEGQDRNTGAMGYPNACAKVEQLLTVVEILGNGNGLRFTPAAEFDHFTDVRDWPTDWGGTGLPRATSLDRTTADGFDGYTYLDKLELKNWRFLPPANGGLGYFITPCASFTLTNCDVDIYNQFSQILRLCTSTGNTYRRGCEYDKDLVELVSTNDRHLGAEPYTNGRWRKLTMTGGFFERSNCLAGRRQEYIGCTFTAGPVNENGGTVKGYGARYPQPGHKPIDLLIYRAGQTFVSHAQSEAPAYLEDAPHDFYTVGQVDANSNDLLVPAPAWTQATAGQPTPGHDFFRTTCVGMALSTVSGSKAGRITHRSWDAALKCYRFTHNAPKFAVGDKIVYSYVRNLVEEGGHTLDAKPLFHQNSARFQGNTGTGGSYNFEQRQRDLPATGNRQIPFFAPVRQLVVNVTQAGTTGSFLEISNYPMVTMPDGSTSRRICRIDLTQVGARTITLEAGSGAVGGDVLTPGSLGYVEALDFYWPTKSGQFLITGLWANTEAAL